MATYKNSILCILFCLLLIFISYGITGKCDKEQFDKEHNYEESIIQVHIQAKSENCEEALSEPETNLRGLEPYRHSFINASNTYGVDYNLLISIAALESGWGTSYYAQTNNNLFGWCNGEMYFNSKEECIMHVAKFLKENYLTEGGMYFQGYTIEDIGSHYNSRREWAEEVRKIYDSLGGY